MEQITSSSNGLHGNHLYASISGYAVDQPLALTKSSHDIRVAGREGSGMSGTVERQQVRQLVALKERRFDAHSNRDESTKCSMMIKHYDNRNKCDYYVEMFG